MRITASLTAVSGVPGETLRTIEAGRIPTPAFFTVAALAAAVDLPLDRLVRACAEGERAMPQRADTA